jgi:hypothetical protein
MYDIFKTFYNKAKTLKVDIVNDEVIEHPFDDFEEIIVGCWTDNTAILPSTNEERCVDGKEAFLQAIEGKKGVAVYVYYDNYGFIGKTDLDRSYGGFFVSDEEEADTDTCYKMLEAYIGGAHYGYVISRLFPYSWHNEMSQETRESLEKLKIKRHWIREDGVYGFVFINEPDGEVNMYKEMAEDFPDDPGIEEIKEQMFKGD